MTLIKSQLYPNCFRAIGNGRGEHPEVCEQVPGGAQLWVRPLAGLPTAARVYHAYDGARYHSCRRSMSGRVTKQTSVVFICARRCLLWPRVSVSTIATTCATLSRLVRVVLCAALVLAVTAGCAVLSRLVLLSPQA